MVTISITAEAFAAIEATLPNGTKGAPRLDGKGRHLIVLPHGTIDRLKAMRLTGETFPHVLEMALGHQVGNAVERACRRTDLLDHTPYTLMSCAGTAPAQITQPNKQP
jgi:hypothetical protein